jgi:hypothetical protein
MEGLERRGSSLNEAYSSTQTQRRIWEGWDLIEQSSGSDNVVFCLLLSLRYDYYYGGIVAGKANEHGLGY